MHTPLVDVYRRPNDRWHRFHKLIANAVQHPSVVYFVCVCRIDVQRERAVTAVNMKPVARRYDQTGRGGAVFLRSL